MTTTAAWFDVTAMDASRSREFYGDLLDCDVSVIESLDYGLVQPTSDGIAGGIGQAGEGNPHPAGVVLYLVVDRLEDALGRAVRSGGRRAVEPWELEGFGRMAVVEDPDGNRVGVWERPAAAQPVIVSGYVRVPPQRRRQYLDAMDEFVRSTREQPGCLDLVVAADPVEDDRINNYEHWESEAHLARFRSIADPPLAEVELLEVRVAKHTIAATGPAFD